MDDGSTCWTVIRAAADGSREDREEFARRYMPVVRAFLLSKWAGSPLRAEVDDAIQEVFLACFKEGGALEEADSTRGFRTFLFGVTRNIACRFETMRARRHAMEGVPLDAESPEDAEGLSTLFDRAWARAVVREAAKRQWKLARDRGPEARQRVELLHLRFHEGLPIREIASLWKEDALKLHRAYPSARAEFREALVDVVGFHCPGPRDEVERECGWLLKILVD